MLVTMLVGGGASVTRGQPESRHSTSIKLGTALSGAYEPYEHIYAHEQAIPTLVVAAIVGKRFAPAPPRSTFLHEDASPHLSIGKGAPPPLATGWGPRWSVPDPVVQRHEPFLPAARSTQRTSNGMHTGALAGALAHDDSEYALHPKYASLDDICHDAFDTTYENQNSMNKLDSNLRLWARYAADMGTPVWRPDVSALDELGRQREALLAANFIRWSLTKMKGRKGNARALPASAGKILTGVVKAHKHRNVTMTSAPLIKSTLKRLCRKHIEDYGARSLIPKRKQPFTTAIILALANATPGKYGRWTLDWKDRSGMALLALICVLAATGMRKSEVTIDAHQKFDKTCASLGNVSWYLRGQYYSVPPPEYLRNRMDGDYLIIIPPLSKSDQTGEVWGANPIYIPYYKTTATNAISAFDAMADLELSFPTQESRDDVPMISPDGRSPFTADFLDRLLPKLLQPIVGTNAVTSRLYSWHSMRIYRACSLLAAGASVPQIQAMCRWQTEESLAIYARLNPAVYKYWLLKSINADVSSVTTSALEAITLDVQDIDTLVSQQADSIL